MPNHLGLSIANEFLRKSPQLTNMQLQKLSYIAHGWNLAINDEPLIADPIEAWDNGPVIRTLWSCMRRWGSAPIGQLLTPKNTNWFAPVGVAEEVPYTADLTPSEKAVIDHVWNKYGRFNAFELSDMTHRIGTPWTKTYFERGRNSLIENELIKQHYRQLALAGRNPG